MLTKSRISFIALLTISFSFTLIAYGQQLPLSIAISWERSPDSYQYSSWLSEADSNLRFVVLYEQELEKLQQMLDTCDALLLTGGNDIYPAWYGKEADTARCGVFNHKRDTLEMKALSLALKNEMPVMGICRGMQLINVYHGGTLHIDLPEDTESEKLHRGALDNRWTQHWIYPDKQFFPLQEMALQPQMIASNHHQGIEHLGDGLQIIARSADSLPEAIKFKDSDKPFLFAVQWHPEWKPLAGEMAKPTAKLFLEAAAQYKRNN